MNSISTVNFEKNGDAAYFIDPVQGDKMLGAFRAACGIKGVVTLVHAPVGCHWGVNFIERLSTVKTNAAVSALRERSVVFGGEESLKKTIEILLKKRKNRYLILLAGSVPSIIGEDWQGVIDSVGFDLHSISLDCGGFLGNMGNGYEACIGGFYRWMDDPVLKKTGSSPKINLIGIQRDIARGEADIKELERILGLVGIGVNAVFPSATLAELKRGTNADLNVVLGYGSLLAGKMQEHWGIPFVLYNKYPYGIAGTIDFIQGIGNRLGIDPALIEKQCQKEKEKTLNLLNKAHLYLPTLYGFPAAIAADLPQANGLSEFLSVELGLDIKAVHVTSSPRSAAEGVEFKDICENILFQTSWDQFEAIVEKKNIKLIFGSDLEGRISSKGKSSLILISYPATSRIILTPLPYMGFKGVLTLVEEMVNNVIHAA